MNIRITFLVVFFFLLLLLLSIHFLKLLFFNTEILTLKEVFQISSNGEYHSFHQSQKQKNSSATLAHSPFRFLTVTDLDTAINRYSRLSKKKENEKVRSVTVGY